MEQDMKTWLKERPKRDTLDDIVECFRCPIWRQCWDKYENMREVYGEQCAANCPLVAAIENIPHTHTLSLGE